MILQALNEYYHRMESSRELAPPGFQPKEIPFVIVLDESGALVQVEDTRSGNGRERTARGFLLPQAAKKSVNVAANLLWGNAEYVLGVPDAKKLETHRAKGTETRYRSRLVEMHQAFVDAIDAQLASVLNDPGVAAVRAFLRNPDLARLSGEPAWPDIEATNPDLTFRLTGDPGEMPVSARPAVAALLKQEASRDADDDSEAVCLVTGESDRAARIHPAIKGVWGAQTSGANIVSFNLEASNSFGKQQGANAPVGERAAFAYTTALNHLLRKGSSQRMQVGDASTVFWAAKACRFEDDLADIFGAGAGSKDDPNRVQAVRDLLKATETGAYRPERDDPDTRFYILGLAPNAARIAVRFWHAGPVKEFAVHVAQHFRDLEIVRPAYAGEFLPLWKLLNATALQGKSENVAPHLAGDTLRAIVTGGPYPATLLQAAVRRCRAERDVPYARSAVIKAVLNRFFRHRHLKELAVSLDVSNTDPGYRLGRLFAALEQVQRAAQPGIGATIRERYYGAASSSPASVFPVLLRLKNHHLAKLDKPGLVVWYEKLLGEIVGGLDAFPPQLDLQEQGLFAIGYYHQQQDFYTRHTESEPAESTTATQRGN